MNSTRRSLLQVLLAAICTPFIKLLYPAKEFKFSEAELKNDFGTVSYEGITFAKDAYIGDAWFYPPSQDLPRLLADLDIARCSGRPLTLPVILE